MTENDLSLRGLPVANSVEEAIEILGGPERFIEILTVVIWNPHLALQLALRASEQTIEVIGESLDRKALGQLNPGWLTEF